MKAATRKCDDVGYQARVKAQTLAWATGRPYHNRVDDECCSDFSCCHPDLFTASDEARWSTYRQEHGTAALN